MENGDRDRDDEGDECVYGANDKIAMRADKANCAPNVCDVCAVFVQLEKRKT